MSEERCECCDLPTMSCGKAIEQRNRQQERAAEPNYVRARYGGKCLGCGDRFGPDDLITWVDTGWVAECCA